MRSRSDRCPRAAVRRPAADSPDGGAIVDLPPPPVAVCQEVARMLIGIFARQAVADLGLRAVEGSAAE